MIQLNHFKTKKISFEEKSSKMMLRKNWCYLHDRIQKERLNGENIDENGSENNLYLTQEIWLMLQNMIITPSSKIMKLMKILINYKIANEQMKMDS